MNILGISCFFHDAAAALVQDGIVTAAAEEECFSRIKPDARFPIHAFEFCLRAGKLRGEELDCVVFYEKPCFQIWLSASPKMHYDPESGAIVRA